LQQYNSDPYSF
nr:immunoglobulin light chain junction region [Macaca mulatta]